MANIKSSIKRIAVAERNRESNKPRRSEISTLIRQFEQAIAEEEHDVAQDLMRRAEKRLRQAENKGIIHKNKINRHISRMHRKYNEATA